MSKIIETIRGVSEDGGDAVILRERAESVVAPKTGWWGIWDSMQKGWATDIRTGMIIYGPYEVIIVQVAQFNLDSNRFQVRKFE